VENRKSNATLDWQVVGKKYSELYKELVNNKKR